MLPRTSSQQVPKSKPRGNPDQFHTNPDLTPPTESRSILLACSHRIQGALISWRAPSGPKKQVPRNTLLLASSFRAQEHRIQGSLFSWRAPPGPKTTGFKERSNLGKTPPKDPSHRTQGVLPLNELHITTIQDLERFRIRSDHHPKTDVSLSSKSRIK